MLNKVLLVHGYMDGGETWGRLVEQLTSNCPALKDATFVAPSITVSSDDTSTSAATLEHYRDQMLTALGDATERSVLVVGHSMGGAVAELVAIAAEASIAAVVLITPVPLAGAKLPLETEQQFRAGLQNRSAEGARAARLAWSRNLDDEALAIMERTSEATSTKFGLQQLGAWNGGHPAGSEHSPLRCPVLMITTEDPFFSRELLVELTKRYDRSTVRHIADAGHWSHVEQAGALAGEICAFLASKCL